MRVAAPPPSLTAAAAMRASCLFSEARRALPANTRTLTPCSMTRSAGFDSDPDCGLALELEGAERCHHDSGADGLQRSDRLAEERDAQQRRDNRLEVHRKRGAKRAD